MNTRLPVFRVPVPERNNCELKWSGRPALLAWGSGSWAARKEECRPGELHGFCCTIGDDGGLCLFWDLPIRACFTTSLVFVNASCMACPRLFLFSLSPCRVACPNTTRHSTKPHALNTSLNIPSSRRLLSPSLHGCAPFVANPVLYADFLGLF